MKPDLASFLRKIDAILKLMRQMGLKPSFSLRVSQSLTGSMESMKAREAGERGVLACL